MRIDEWVAAVERGAADEVSAAVRAEPSLLSLRTADGDTLLHVACWQKQAAIVTALLARGADANARGFHGRTALHYAVHDGREASVAIVQTLLDHGADRDLRDDGGYTPAARAQQEMWGPALAAVLARLGSSRSPVEPAPAGDDFAATLAQVRAIETQGQPVPPAPADDDYADTLAQVRAIETHGHTVEPAPAGDDYAATLAQVRAIETHSHTLVALARLLAAFTEGPAPAAERAADGLPAADLRCLADAQRVLDTVAATSWAAPLREWLRTEATPALLEQWLRSYRQTGAS